MTAKQINRLDGFFAEGLRHGIVRIDMLFASPDKASPDGAMPYRVIQLHDTLDPAKADAKIRELIAGGEVPEGCRFIYSDGEERVAMVPWLEQEKATISETGNVIRNLLDEPSIN
jgi:hypothetical protein